MTAKCEVARVVYEQGDALVELARGIHADSETAFSERRSSARLVDLLSDSGFEIRTGVCGLATAFIASRGAGPIHLMLCAEYDALDDGIGHGSGRHLVGAAAAGAAIALAAFAEETGSTVSVLGTPGADLLALTDPPAGHVRPGKPVLLECGAFDDAHAVLMIVPSASFTGLAPSGSAGERAADIRPWARTLSRAMRADYGPVRQLRQDPLLRRAFVRNADGLGLVQGIGATRPALNTDLGAVSARIPVIAPVIGIGGDARIRTREFAALADTDDAYRQMLHGAVALAWTALGAVTQDELRTYLLRRRAARPAPSA